MTEIHNEGCECEMCRWANKSSSPPATSSALDFDHHWNSAPPQHTRYTEKDEAEHWFRRGLWVGIQYERERGLLAMNGDLREMQRLAREKVGR